MDKDFMIDYLASLAITLAGELEKLEDMEKGIDKTYLGSCGAIFAMREQFTEEEMNFIMNLPIVKHTLESDKEENGRA